MSDQPRLLICNCENTMQLDGEGLGEALGRNPITVHKNLCRRDLAQFQRAASESGDLLIGCTQEAPLFREIIDEEQLSATARFFNIRECAGWSADDKLLTPKIAALIEEASLTAQPVRLKSIHSDGLCLVYGRGQQALEAARLLSSRLSVTLILNDAEDVILPQVLDFAVYKGTIKQINGSFGGFNLVIDDHAALLPSSRGDLQFAMARDGLQSKCSQILDLTGKTPLLPHASKRDGYFHIDPKDPAALMRAVFDLSDMVGEFEKPIYVEYEGSICAHARNQKTGCSKCLDVCPASAISPAGETISIDPLICGGCGSCHAVCPTGAISYAYPSRQDIVTRLVTLSETFHQSGGKHPVLLVYDDNFGGEVINSLARFYRGLPAHVIPFGVHAATVFGHTEMLAALTAGFGDLVFLCDPKNEEELTGLHDEMALVEAILSHLQLKGRLLCLTEADPERVENQLYALSPCERPVNSFAVTGEKRSLARMAVRKLAEMSLVDDPIILPEKAPYGRVAIDLEACTLCMSCVSACPANALMDTPNEPRLRFVEQACVQCSLCVKTCPEKALSLEPRLDWSASAMQPVTLKEEDPFECIRCGTPFATQSTIARISEQLAGKHSMFADDERADLIKMCGDCRVAAQAESANNPFGMGERPRIRTTQDYIDSAAQGLSVDDFLIKH